MSNGVVDFATLKTETRRRFVRSVRAHHSSLPVTIDAVAWPLGMMAAVVLVDSWSSGGLVRGLLAGLMAATVQILAGRLSGLYRSRWRVCSFEEVVALGRVWLLAVAVTWTIAGALVPGLGPDRATIVLGGIIALAAGMVARVVWRTWRDNGRRPKVEYCRRVIVFGAGEGGRQIVSAMLSDPDSDLYPVAVLDDDPTKSNREIRGLPVVGNRSDVSRVAAETAADVLLVAVPSASSALVKDLIKAGGDAGLDVLVLPSVAELVGRMSISDVRSPNIEDLLGRDPVEIDLSLAEQYIRGRRVLITGAGGSIGSELSRQVARFGPAELYLLDRDESALHGLQLSLEGKAMLDSEQLVLADIRDRRIVFDLFHRLEPEVVFHTAALKHLTLLERHPIEGIKTNVIGTKNLLDAAKATGVSRFINISTDKAAEPTSVLGATKLAAERLTAIAADEVQRPFASVRFGNVLGSRGSVIPTFVEQIAIGGPVTVTDPDVTRYFMTIPEAVRLVVQAGAIAERGEVLVLDMGEPVRIVDLAKQLINSMNPGVEIEYTGLRPGEKLHEILIAYDEMGVAKVHPRIIHTTGTLADPLGALDIMDDDSVAVARELLASEDSRLNLQRS